MCNFYSAIVDEKGNGKQIGYYEDGNIGNEWNYKNGELHGKQVEYYRNGKVAYAWNCGNDGSQDK